MKNIFALTLLLAFGFAVCVGGGSEKSLPPAKLIYAPSGEIIPPGSDSGQIPIWNGARYVPGFLNTFMQGNVGINCMNPSVLLEIDENGADPTQMYIKGRNAANAAIVLDAEVTSQDAAPGLFLWDEGAPRGGFSLEQNGMQINSGGIGRNATPIFFSIHNSVGTEIANLKIDTSGGYNLYSNLSNSVYANRLFPLANSSDKTDTIPNKAGQFIIGAGGILSASNLDMNISPKWTGSHTWTSAMVGHSTIQGKMIDSAGQVYNVKAYGALGDGTTDDATAIQNAINATPSGGGIVYFPAGTYAISSKLSITKSVTLMGVGKSGVTGADVRTNSWNPSTVLKWAGGADTMLIIATAGAGVRDMELNGRNVATYGIAGRSMQGSTISNVGVDSCLNTALYLYVATGSAGNNTTYNLIEAFSSYGSRIAIGLHGDNTESYNGGNCCHNSFVRCDLNSDSVCLYVKNADNNTYSGIFTYLNTTGTGHYGMVLDSMAHSERVYGIEPASGILARAPLPALGAIGNVVFGYDMDNGQPAPTFEAGANLTWTSDGLNSTGWHSAGNIGAQVGSTSVMDSAFYTPKGVHARGALLSGNLTLSNMTLGSIPYFGTGGLISQDNSNFFWDGTNHRLGLGLLSPATTLDVTGGINQTQTLTTAGATNNIVSLNATANPSASDNGIYRNFIAANTLSGNSQTFGGTQTLHAIEATARHQGSGSMVGASSLYADTRNASTGSLTNAYGVFSWVTSLGGSNSTITNAYGLFTSNRTAASSNITNAYGLYIDNYLRTGTINHAYGIYQVEAADTNYFNGWMGIGTNAPSTQFSIAEKFNINSTGTVTKVNNIAAEGGFGVPAIVDTVEKSAATASIAATNLNGTTIAGAYEIDYYGSCTTANGTSTVSITIDWDNNAKSSTSATFSNASTANFVQGHLYIRHVPVSASSIRWSTTVAGTIGTAQYQVSVIAKRVY